MFCLKYAIWRQVKSKDFSLFVCFSFYLLLLLFKVFIFTQVEMSRPSSVIASNLPECLLTLGNILFLVAWRAKIIFFSSQS